MGIFGKPPESKPADPTPRQRPTPPVARAPDLDRAPRRARRCRPAERRRLRDRGQDHIKGEITGDEDMLVEGRVEGQIRITRDLRVGPGGIVKATVEAQSVDRQRRGGRRLPAAMRVEIQASGQADRQHPGPQDRDRRRGDVQGQQRHVGPPAGTSARTRSPYPEAGPPLATKDAPDGSRPSRRTRRWPVRRRSAYGRRTRRSLRQLHRRRVGRRRPRAGRSRTATPPTATT